MMSEPACSDAESCLDQIYQTFTAELEGEGRLPASQAEIDRGRDLLAQAEAFGADDEETAERLRETREVLDDAAEREFVGSKWMMIGVGLAALFFLYTGYSGMTATEYTAEHAQKTLTSQINRLTQQADLTAKRIESEPQNQAKLEKRLESQRVDAFFTNATAKLKARFARKAAAQA
jgi:hypothetical protein